MKGATDLEFYNKEEKQKAARKRLAASYAGGGQVKYAAGGKVENGHDITYARGSGAARPQIFRKNG